MRRWYTKQEVIQKFGEESGMAIIYRKLADPDLARRETRRHPENPDDDSLVQYLVLDLEEVVDEEEDLLSQMYSVAEASTDDSSDSSDNKKQKKKNKSKKASKKKKKTSKDMGFETCMETNTQDLV